MPDNNRKKPTLAETLINFVMEPIIRFISKRDAFLGKIMADMGKRHSMPKKLSSKALNLLTKFFWRGRKGPRKK